MCCKVKVCPVPKSMFQLMSSVLEMLTLWFNARSGLLKSVLGLPGRAKLCRVDIVVCLVQKHSRSPRMISDGIGGEHFDWIKGTRFFHKINFLTGNGFRKFQQRKSLVVTSSKQICLHTVGCAWCCKALHCTNSSPHQAVLTPSLFPFSCLCHTLLSVMMTSLLCLF